MERFRVDEVSAFRPNDPRLERVTVAPLTEPLGAGAPVQAAVFRLAAGGRIARHPADVPQILAVLDGAAVVSGGDGERALLGPGDAVFWTEGEEHETVSEPGLIALVLEGPRLTPFRRP